MIVQDGEIVMNISTFDHTFWVWPRQEYFLQDCLPKPVFMLNNSYFIKVGSNIIETNSYTPYSHCQNAKFLVRVCDASSTNKTDCTEVDWITVDQASGNAILVMEKITSAGIRTGWFQAQSFTFVNSEYLGNDKPFDPKLTDFSSTTFHFILMITLLWDKLKIHRSALVIRRKTESRFDLTGQQESPTFW